jgi:hypothetical protein
MRSIDYKKLITIKSKRKMMPVDLWRGLPV